AARRLKELYATYLDAEDLINIGIFAAGSNRRIDGAVALIDRVRDFLVQRVGDRTSFEQTIRQMTEITDRWYELLSSDSDKNRQSVSTAVK
ncbi:MAG TPA: hypothetical protein PKV53_02785, partial [Anaerohalosphaeraceae bacterium]|nr:hypothetical protein [Anaerohalosphaeraceae bacterium]